MKKSAALVIILAIILLGVDVTHWKDTALSRLGIVSEQFNELADADKPASNASQKLTGRIVRVVDGDTVDFNTESARHRVRLTEIDTPEADQPWGSEATKALAQKIAGKDVELRASGTDRYGRILGRIYYEGRDINREMIAEGHAWVYRQYMTEQTWLKDEAKAKGLKLGLWSQDNLIAPWEWRQGARPVAELTEIDSACGTKRYCREMSSCAEALFYLEECGVTRLDGDMDGTPCESICR